MKEAIGGLQEPVAVQVDTILNSMSLTEERIEATRKRNEALWKQKEEIKNGSGSKAEKKAKVKPIKAEIKEGDRLMAALRQQLIERRKELEALGGKKGNDAADESSLSSGYE